MLLIERQIWASKAVSEDTTLESVEAQLAHSLSYILTLAGSGFSGTLDIQCRESNTDTWSNIAYRALDSGGGAGALSTASLVLGNYSDRNRYIVPIAPVQVRLSLVRNSGSISAWVRGSATPILPPTGSGPVDYYKLSTEPRPGSSYFDAATHIAVGATLLEYDTGIRFVYVGDTKGGWARLDSSSNLEGLLAQILRELTLLRLGQELVLLDENFS